MTEVPSWVKLENWRYCALCECVIYIMDCCSHSTCSGGGCKECSPEKHQQITILIDQGKCPRYEELIKVSTKEQLDKIFNPSIESE